MSYILEALKKSEKKRREEQSPVILREAQPVLPGLNRGRRKPWPQIMLILLIVAAGAALGYFLSVPENTPSISQNLPPPPQQNQENHDEQGVTEEQSAPPELRATSIKVAVAPDVAAKRDEIIEPAPIAETDTNPTTQANAKYADIPFLEDLDLSFRQTVPEFKLAGHVYSPDPELRMILINSSVIREKDIVAKDFMVEEITPDGIIMRMGEIRFRMKAY